MRKLMICYVMVLGLAAGSVYAGEIRELELNDGSIITGEVVSLSNGIYTIKSDILGPIKLEESKIRTIRAKSPLGNASATQSNNNSVEQAKSLQEKIMSDKEVMTLIQSLQNDPDFKKILEDPEVMKAVTAGDTTALAANPKFMKLLNNSTVQEIGKKVK